MNQRTLRKLHRWLGLIAGIQLLAWTISGLYFTLIPIDDIHGDHLLNRDAPTPPALAQTPVLSPSDIASGQPSLAEAHLTDVQLTLTGELPVYIIDGQRFNAATGEALPILTVDEARAVVAARSDASILAIDFIESVAIDSEYRGGPLPAWRITTDVEDAAIYVDATTGRLRAVRTNSWRLFDFLWSLHIMDYDEREDFNHWLIKLLAILSLVTVLSGLTLFFMTQRWRRRKPAAETSAL